MSAVSWISALRRLVVVFLVQGAEGGGWIHPPQPMAPPWGSAHPPAPSGAGCPGEPCARERQQRSGRERQPGMRASSGPFSS